MTDYTVVEGHGSPENTGTNILVVTSGFTHKKGHSWFRHAELSRSSEIAALFVTSSQSQTDCYKSWQETIGGQPAKLAVVGEGNQGQSFTADQTDSHRNPSVTVRDIRDDGDLIEVGIAVSELLEEWETEDHRVVVWFESLAEPIQRSGISHVYRFLAELTSRLNEMGAIGCFLLDTDSSNENEITLLESLFDDVVRQDSHTANTSGKEPRTAEPQDTQEADIGETTDMGFVYPEDESSGRNPRAISDEETCNEVDSNQ